MRLDIEALIKLVGTDGARAALRASTTVTLEDLRSAGAKLGGSSIDTTERTKVIDALLASYENRLTVPLEELQKLSQAAILEYFRKSRCSMAELELFLKRAEIPYRRGITKSKLMAEAARQISGMGLYEHIAGGPKLVEVEAHATQPAQRDEELLGLEGVWHSDLGTRMSLRLNGDVIEGKYRKPDDAESDLFGRTGGATLAGRPFVSLIALWDDGRREASSATAWVGYVEKLGGEEIIVTSWVRVEGFYEPGRVSTSVGKEYLRRRPPRDEEVDRARKLHEAPYPRRRR